MSAPWDGKPENPERDGWHWLRHKSATFAVPYEWRTPGFWVHRDNVPMLESEQRHFALDMIYLGPCLMPADHAAAVQAERAAASGARPVAWSEFDYASPPDGLCWVEVERPETWCDVDYQGRSVGGYTGETTVVVVLTEISMTSHGPDFGVVGSGDFGRVDHDDRVVRFLSLTAPPDTSALAEAIEAARREGYRAGWNDREGDLLAGIDRVYGAAADEAAISARSGGEEGA